MRLHPLALLLASLLWVGCAPAAPPVATPSATPSLLESYLEQSEQAKDPAQALTLARTAVDLAEAQKPSPQLATRACKRWGEAAYAAGDLEQALKAFTQLGDRDPSAPERVRTLTAEIALRRTEQLASRAEGEAPLAAITTLNEAAEGYAKLNKPERVAKCRARQAALLEVAHDTYQAEDLWVQALKLDPANSAYQRGLADCRAKRGPITAAGFLEFAIDGKDYYCPLDHIEISTPYERLSRGYSRCGVELYPVESFQNAFRVRMESAATGTVDPRPGLPSSQELIPPGKLPIMMPFELDAGLLPWGLRRDEVTPLDPQNLVGQPLDAQSVLGLGPDNQAVYTVHGNLTIMEFKPLSKQAVMEQARELEAKLKKLGPLPDGKTPQDLHRLRAAALMHYQRLMLWAIRGRVELTLKPGKKTAGGVRKARGVFQGWAGPGPGPRH